ncbi:MAG: type I polyketide synthase, partial [Acidobacteriota bacterium]
DTACSGSLLAIDLACRSLRSGETTMALAGGVAVNLQPNGDIFFSRAGSLSTEGRCRTFDISANGMVRSEGAGILVLKPLARAVADGDQIYAVIRGSAVNHDGRSNGIMSPNGLAQEAMLRLAYRNAGVSPGQVQYIEAHGTGTRVGDPVEVKALTAVLGTDRPPGFACALGSVKTNIGHSESAAGVAGVIKVALSLFHRTIPPHLHLKELNPLIPTAEFPIKIYQNAGPWPAEEETLMAGVSSFSFGGTNVHLVLEEAPEPAAITEESLVEGEWVLPLSARSPESLRGLARQYEHYLWNSSESILSRDVCFTAAVRRSHHEHRLAVVGSSLKQFASGLKEWLDGETPSNVVIGRRQGEGGTRLVFVFSGQGSHWLGMGRELYRTEEVFRAVIDRCDELIGACAGWSLLAEIHARQEESRLSEIDVAQPAIFAFQVALAMLWRSWGVVPEAIIGQSLGEVAAAHVAGALSLEDAVGVVFHRSRLLRTKAGQGRTAVLGLSLAQARSALAGLEQRLSVAGSSGPTSSVISGDPLSVDLVLRDLESRDIFCRVLENVDAAAHSPQMDALKCELRDSVRGITPCPTTIPFFSTVTGGLLEGTELGADYWARNLREPFLFADVTQNLIENGYETFLEISSHPALLGAIRQSFTHLGRDGEAVGSISRDLPERASLKQAIASLYVAGYEMDWSRQFNETARRIKSPGYVWQRERYWYDQLKTAGTSASSHHRSAQHPLLGSRFSSAASPGDRLWENELSAESLHYLKDHRIRDAVVLPGAAYLEMAVGALAEESAAGNLILEEISFDRLLLLPDAELRTIQTVFTPARSDPGGSAVSEFRVYSSLVPDGGEQTRPPEVWTLHAKGMARSVISAGDDSHLDLAKLKAECSEPLSIDAHYDAMRARGLNYGPSFRCLKKLWRGEGRALGFIEFAQSRESELTAYRIHPAVLDAGFQVVAAAFPASEGDSYLPRGVRRLIVYDRFSSAVWCHAQLEAGAYVGAEQLLSGLAFCDASGRVIAEIEGLKLSRMDATPKASQRDVFDSIYQVKWRPQPNEDAPVRARGGRWLILGDRSGLGDAIAARLAEAGDSAVVMHSDKRAELEAVVSGQVSGAGDQEPFIGVIHLWGLDIGSFEGDELAGLDLAQQLGPLSGLAIIRGLSRRETRAATKVWMVTRGAQAIRNDRIAVLQRGVWGLGRALAVEHPELWGGLIDVDQNRDLDATTREICLDLLRPDQEHEVAWRDGERFVPRLVRMDERRSEAVECRADSSYLVTGGLSGLGLEAARWLIARGARRLIIVGRRGLPARSEWTGLTDDGEGHQRVESVRELERMGASIEYWAVNVADEQEMRQRWDIEKAEGRPPIRGIIHAAGVIEDVLAMRMNEKTYERVQEGKVKGALVLNKLARGLDFFIAYSSLSGVLGQIGQANYGAANAYLDGLMEYRRQRGKAGLSIAWGPWAEVGIYSREGVSTRAKLIGVEEIDRRQGDDVLSVASRANETQIVVVNANWANWPEVRKTRMISELMKEEIGDTADEDEDDGEALLLSLILAEPIERRSMLESYLRETVARVLRSDAVRLSLSKPLTAMGLDSIMAVELRNVIQSTLGLNVSMVDLLTGATADLVKRLDEQLAEDSRLPELLAEVEGLPEGVE